MAFPQFSGAESVAEFVEDLEEFLIARKVEKERAHAYFRYVLKGRAWDWYTAIARHLQPAKDETKYEMTLRNLLQAFGENDELIEEYSEEEEADLQVEEKERQVSEKPSRKRKAIESMQEPGLTKRRRLSVEPDQEAEQEATQQTVEKAAQDMGEDIPVEMQEQNDDVTESSKVHSRRMEPRREMEPSAVEASIQKKAEWKAEPGSTRESSCGEEHPNVDETESLNRWFISTDEPGVHLQKNASMTRKRTMESLTASPDARSPELRQIVDKESPPIVETVRATFRRRPPRQRMKQTIHHIPHVLPRITPPSQMRPPD